MSRSHPLPLTAARVVAAAATVWLLTGCGETPGERTVGQQIDAAIATGEQKSASARSGIRQEVAEARDDVSQASTDLRRRAAAAADSVADKVEDATITASVNAELAKDADLSALKIDVDTVDGKVMLQGTAPNSEARERASRLAANVQGVTRVDNRLQVRS